MEPKRILVIAGSDSSGGAGLEADQKVIAVHGCYAMTATTALTAQNTQGVSAIHHVPSDFVVKQIESCVVDIGVDVVKIGMLASAATVDAVAAALDRHLRPTTVLDPVMVSTSGAQLLPNHAVSNLLTHLLPLTTILTPNIPEARLLLEHAGIPVPPISSTTDLIKLAKLVHKLGPKNVLLKGGHVPLPRKPAKPTVSSDQTVVLDILVAADSDPSNPRVTIYQTDHVASRNTHGTGCSLASAIACCLALGRDVPDAVRDSVCYVEKGIQGALNWRLGAGSGPIDHFHPLRESRTGWEARREGSSLVQWDWDEGEGMV